MVVSHIGTRGRLELFVNSLQAHVRDYAEFQNSLLDNPIIHLFYPPKILHNHCLQVLLGHEDVLREIKNNAYANFWGVKEVYYGICASSECSLLVVHST